MKWESDIPPKEVIEKNKELLAKWPFLEKRNIFSGEGYEGEARYYRTNYDDWNGTGWEQIWKTFIVKLAKLWENLPDEDFKKRFQIWDTKEKYGTLRVSLPGYTEEMGELVSSLRDTSRYTCISCGKQPKDSRGNRIIWTSKGWICPYCKKCAKEHFLIYFDRAYKEKPKIKMKEWKEGYDKETHKGPFTSKSYSDGKWETHVIKNLEDF